MELAFRNSLNNLAGLVSVITEWLQMGQGPSYVGELINVICSAAVAAKSPSCV